MWTGDNCVWCDRFIIEVIPQLEKAGWKVGRDKHIEIRRSTGGPIPRFDVIEYIDGEAVIVSNRVGFMDKATFIKWVHGNFETAVYVPVESEVLEPMQQIRQADYSRSLLQ